MASVSVHLPAPTLENCSVSARYLPGKLKARQVQACFVGPEVHDCASVFLDIEAAKALHDQLVAVLLEASVEETRLVAG